MTRLGINIDHTATVRQARKEIFPDPVELAQAAIRGGADGITAHLREDRRHIQDDDIVHLKKTISVPLNLEMAATDEIIDIATTVKPAWCCLVPEKREELTTEGGLNLMDNQPRFEQAVKLLQAAGIKVSAFIEPDTKVVTLAKDLCFDAVELHTGIYAKSFKIKTHHENCSGTNLALRSSYDHELKKITQAAQTARKVGLLVNAGHGLDTDNIQSLIKQFQFDEFNIGFAIVARALMIGMESSVKEMKSIIRETVCVES